MHALTDVALPAAALVTVALIAIALGPAGCAREVGTEEVGDAAFVVTTDAGLDDATTSDAVDSVCSVLDPSACPTETPRCVPGAEVVTVCVASGPGAEGDPCGADDAEACGYGLLCAADDAGVARCRRICRSGALCPDDSTCTPALVRGGEEIGLCAAP